MKKHVVAFLTLLVFCPFLSAENPEVLDVAVLGLGGRSQAILLECLKLKDQVHKKIRVVAVCDNHGQDSLNFFIDRLSEEKNPLTDGYKEMLSRVIFYKDDEQGLIQLFKNHPHLDRILIT